MDTWRLEQPARIAGETWGDFSFVFRTQPPGPGDYQHEPRYSEMDLVPLPNDHWVAYSRHERLGGGPVAGATAVAISTDLGRTWTKSGGIRNRGLGRCAKPWARRPGKTYSSGVRGSGVVGSGVLGSDSLESESPSGNARSTTPTSNTTIPAATSQERSMKIPARPSAAPRKNTPILHWRKAVSLTSSRLNVGGAPLADIRYCLRGRSARTKEAPDPRRP